MAAVLRIPSASEAASPHSLSPDSGSAPGSPMKMRSVSCPDPHTNDPIIQEMLANRSVDDVPPEFEAERRRRMYNMLRHSKHYKKLQVARANDTWDKSLQPSPISPISVQSSLQAAEGGILDASELDAALSGLDGTPSAVSASHSSLHDANDTGRNSSVPINLETAGEHDGRQVASTEASAHCSRRSSEEFGGADEMLSVDTGLGRGIRPVVRSHSTLDANGSDMARSPSTVAMARAGRARRRRGVSFDEHVFVMEEPGVMFSLKNSGNCLTPFTPSPSSTTGAGSHDSVTPPGNGLMEDSDTEYSLLEDFSMPDGGRSSPILVSPTGGRSAQPRGDEAHYPRRTTEHVHWADVGMRVDPVDETNAEDAHGENDGYPGSGGSPVLGSDASPRKARSLRSMFRKAIGIGD
ncbi:hypothetical protein DFJ74DRAFT_412925 [Hyaloraphidium curvatum]|nr:hypothetical protein DFJ74DRAFT_412925 [Hyaloraphidium curvatum]